MAVAQVYQNFPNPVRMGERGRPDVSSILDVSSVLGGILGPRMTEVQRDAIPDPKPALFIFNTDADEYQVYNGVSWQPMGASALDTLNDVNVTSPQIDEILVYDGAAWVNSDVASLEDIEVKNRFEVTGTDSASIPCPVMDETARDLLTPVAGDCIYNSDASTLNVYDGVGWKLVGSGGLNKWETGEEYEADDVIWESGTLKIYTANTPHTASALFVTDIANWTLLNDYEGKLDKFPSETNDNRVVRTDLNGNTVQGSDVAISDTGAMTGVSSLEIDNLVLDGNTISIADPNGNLNLEPDGVGSIFIGGSGAIITSGTNANLTLDTNGTGIVDVNAPINIESVIANRVVYGNDTTGNLEGSANFLYASSTDLLRVAGLDFTNNTIESVATNSDINISPDGTGEINLQKNTVVTNDMTALGSFIVGDLEISDKLIEVTAPAEDLNINVPSGQSVFINESLEVGDNLTVTGVSNLDGVSIVGGSITELAGGLAIATTSNGDITLSPNGSGSLNAFYDAGTVQTLDRQVEVGELIPNHGFERADLGAVSCTNATITRVADVAGGYFNDWALQITATGTPWSCDIDGAGGQGTGFAELQSVATVGADAEFCILANGVEQVCHESNILTSKSETFTIPTALDATENSIRIKGTSASNVVTADKASMKAGQLTTTGYFRQETVSLIGAATPSGSFTAGEVIVTREGNLVNVKLSVPAAHSSSSNITSVIAIPEWARGSKAARVTFASDDATSSNNRSFEVNADGTVQFIYGGNRGDSGGDDLLPSVTYPAAEAQTVQSFNSMVYKSAASLSNEGTTTNVAIGATTITMPFDTIKSITNMSWNTSTNIGTFEASGWYTVTFNGIYNLSATSSMLAVVELNDGSGYAVPSSVKSCNVMTTTSSERQPFSCPFYFFARAGDLIRVRVTSDQASSVILNGTANRTPSLIIKPEPNPNGEPVSAVIANEFVSGGVEQVVAGETWDGRQVYRRSFELTSTISTTGTVITTIPTGLEPIEVMRYGGNFYTLLSSGNGAQATNNNHSYIIYNTTNGQISCFLAGTNNCQVGTRFTMKYLKP
jgi:hypothetical protein